MREREKESGQDTLKLEQLCLCSGVWQIMSDVGFMRHVARTSWIWLSVSTSMFIIHTSPATSRNYFRLSCTHALTRLNRHLDASCLLTLLGRLLLCRKVITPARTSQLGQELADSLLINLVLGILLSAQLLGKPSAGLEEDQVRKGAHTAPVVEARGCDTRPLVKRNPDKLLADKVGVSRVAEETSGVEAWLKIFTSPPGRKFGSLLVGVLGLVKVPLRLVGKPFEDNEGQEATGKDGVDSGHVLSGKTGREHEDVGGCCDYEEEETLGNANEEDVEEEEERAAEPATHNLPTVVF
jgi:hypothetical protein